MTFRLESLQELRQFASDDVLTLNGIDSGPNPKTMPAVQAEFVVAGDNGTTNPGNKPSVLELKFVDAWNALSFPALTTEHRFHGARRWRLDFAHVGTKVGIEIEGLVYRPTNKKKSRHQTPVGYTEDCVKYNAAIADGWAVFRLTNSMITHPHLSQIAETIRLRLRSESQP